MNLVCMLYSPTNSLPTSVEVMFTKMFAMTQALYGFVSTKAKSISTRYPFLSSSLMILVTTSQYLVMLRIKRRVSSYYKPFHSLSWMMSGSTNLMNYEERSSQLLKLMSVERQILVSWGVLIFFSICGKRSVPANIILLVSDLAYCKIALRVPCLTSILLLARSSSNYLTSYPVSSNSPCYTTGSAA